LGRVLDPAWAALAVGGIVAVMAVGFTVAVGASKERTQ
jgi:hypothetical protein